MTRIAITGLGSINALGAGVEEFERGLRSGACGIGPVTIFPTEGYRSRVGGQVRDLAAPAWLDAHRARRTSRTALLALIAAREALHDAGLGQDARAGTAVVLGTTVGGMDVGEECLRRMLQGGEQHLSGWLETPFSVPADVLACELGCAGPRATVSTACSSGANALGMAADWIRAGRAPVALCGGADSLCRMTYSGFNCLQALDREPCRPFDRERAGLSLGEGAAMFVLESFEHARARGAAILAEFVSYGTSADAHHLTQPRPDGAGAELAIRRALARGEVGADEVDYINAHGTGTPLNDSVETAVIKRVLGERAYRIAVSSTKSQVGHCLGAAGAVEALACVLALRGGFVPPTVNLRAADPECDLDYVPNASRPAALRAVVSNSYGFGGNNTSVVLRRHDGPGEHRGHDAQGERGTAGPATGTRSTGPGRSTSFAERRA